MAGRTMARRLLVQITAAMISTIALKRHGAGILLVSWLVLGFSTQRALANDFPIASCKSWDGTIVSIEGIDSAKAVMTGAVTDKNLLEYCERDPGGETIEYGGKLTVQQCVEKYRRQTQKLELRSTANCRDGSIVFDRSSARFPLKTNADTSCGSGMPPLIAQFQILCPANARRWNVGGR